MKSSEKIITGTRWQQSRIYQKGQNTGTVNNVPILTMKHSGFLNYVASNVAVVYCSDPASQVSALHTHACVHVH